MTNNLFKKSLVFILLTILLSFLADSIIKFVIKKNNLDTNYYVLIFLSVIIISFFLMGLLIRMEFLFRALAELISKRFKFLERDLELADINISLEEYIKNSLIELFLVFIFLSLFLSSILIRFNQYYLGIIITLIIIIFDFINKLNYPKIKANKRIREIDKNLISALRTILIQINSGVPLFDVFVSISKSDYGEISKIFNKMIKKINTGTPQIQALEEISRNNPSPFFRKSIWQLINGMKAGSKVNKILKNIIDSLSKEQLIQIEKYGSQLNPLAMFYMLIVVIIPSLGLTFITVISSFFSSRIDIKVILITLFILVFVFQIIFLGMIKTKRPSLLEE